MSASAYSNIDNMELLVKKGANINAKQIESAIWLINHGADISYYAGTYGNNALSIAIT